MSLSTAALIVTFVAWTARLTRLNSGGARQSSFIDAALSVAVAALIWWMYLKTTDPSIVHFKDLWHPHSVDAGGGIISTAQYVKFISLVTGLALLFVLAGHFICSYVQAFGVVDFAPGDAGIFYFVGMAVFLSLYVGLATVTGRTVASAIAVVSGLGVMSACTLSDWNLWRRARIEAASGARAFILVLPVIVCTLCLLQNVVTRRGGPMYDEFARHIAATDRLPLINRHFGQSLLASTGLMVFGVGPDATTFARALVNNWLFVSQIAMILLLYRFLREWSLSTSGCVVGVVLVMLGNSALSLLPYILYDHDYPLIMNIYSDSLFGIAGCLILVLYLVDLSDDIMGRIKQSLRWIPTLVVPAAFGIAFNYTAELSAFIMLGVFGVLTIANVLLRLWPSNRLTSLMAIYGLAILVGALGGGVMSSRFRPETGKSRGPFFEQDASSAHLSILHPSWWYVPSVIPGFRTGFGNVPLPTVLLTQSLSEPAAVATASVSDAVNAKLIGRFQQDKSRSWFKYINLIYLVEFRSVQTVQALWFPLIGIAGLTLLVIRSTDTRSDRSKLQLFWIVAITSFTAGLLIVCLTNAEGGNALFWKWALTRAFEPGLCFATVGFIVAVDRMSLGFKSNTRYLIWFALAAFMSFATLFRIIFYPTLNG